MIKLLSFYFGKIRGYLALNLSRTITQSPQGSGSLQPDISM